MCIWIYWREILEENLLHYVSDVYHIQILKSAQMFIYIYIYMYYMVA